jgi:5-methylthioadenosine/S-adenosylhomocysteine deaminase
VTDRTLIRGGVVLTQDPQLGETPNADVLIEGDKVAAIGKDLPADDARVIDATGDIVIPGFVDTHRHTWETCIRTCAPDFALITYFSAILDKFAPHYRPDDVQVEAVCQLICGPVPSGFEKPQQLEQATRFVHVTKLRA